MCCIYLLTHCYLLYTRILISVAPNQWNVNNVHNNFAVAIHMNSEHWSSCIMVITDTSIQGCKPSTWLSYKADSSRTERFTLKWIPCANPAPLKWWNIFLALLICMYIPVRIGASTVGIKHSKVRTTGTASWNNFVISEKEKRKRGIAYSQTSHIMFSICSLALNMVGF